MRDDKKKKQDLIDETQVVKEQEESSNQSQTYKMKGANVGEDSQLSEAGEISSESTSIDVHEPDRTGSEQSEEAELENQTQQSARSTNEQDPGESVAEIAKEEQDTVETPQDEPAVTPIQGLLTTSDEDNPNAKWYVVHTYSGHENRVATAIKQRVEAEHLEHKIYAVLVPTQDRIEIRAGKKENVKEKIFPGYILVKMVLDDASWLAVRTTQGVTSFVGIGNRPTPIPEHEVKTIVRFMEQGAPSTFKDIFAINDTVKIIDGPFSEFIGKIDSVDKEKGKVRVLVSIFGRETPVELDFLQIQKL